MDLKGRFRYVKTMDNKIKLLNNTNQYPKRVKTRLDGTEVSKVKSLSG